MMLKIKILKDIPHLDIKKGEVYEAKAYWLDPSSKYTLIGRVPDGFDPSCNVYRSEVEIVNET